MVEIARDSTQTLSFVPPLGALPTAATVRVQTPSTSLPSSADNATIDSVSTTLGAAAAAGDTSLTLGGATTIVAGTTYRVEPTNAAPFVVVAARASTSTTMYLADPLPCAVANGSALKGITVSHALTTAETSQVGDGFALWALTIGGVAYSYRQPFRIVAALSRYALNGAMLQNLAPLVYANRPGHDEDLSETIAAAWSLHLAPALKAKGVRLERVISAEELIPAHVAAIDLHLAYARASKDPQAIDTAKARFNEALTLALQGNDTWIDSDDEADAGHDDEPPSFTDMRWSL